MTVWTTRFRNSPIPKQVVTHQGWEDPTKRQMDYLRSLADQLGVRVPKVTTRGGASRAIDRLKEKLNETC